MHKSINFPQTRALSHSRASSLKPAESIARGSFFSLPSKQRLVQHDKLLLLASIAAIDAAAAAAVAGVLEMIVAACRPLLLLLLLLLSLLHPSCFRCRGEFPE